MSKRARKRGLAEGEEAAAPVAPAADAATPPPEPPKPPDDGSDGSDGAPTEPADASIELETPAEADADDAGGPGGDEDAAEARPRRRKSASLPPPPPERLDGALEAVLLAAGDVLTPERLRDLLGLPSAIQVREALERVRTRWAAAGLSVELQDVAGGVRVVTRPEFAEYVRRLARVQTHDPRLSQGQLETLSVVAYRQPVPRPEIERIRGVPVGDALRALLERHLVKVVGRSDQPGRPLLYGTTTRFLTAFGLGDLKDLPSGADLSRL